MVHLIWWSEGLKGYLSPKIAVKCMLKSRRNWGVQWVVSLNNWQSLSYEHAYRGSCQLLIRTTHLTPKLAISRDFNKCKYCRIFLDNAIYQSAQFLLHWPDAGRSDFFFSVLGSRYLKVIHDRVDLKCCSCLVISYITIDILLSINAELAIEFGSSIRYKRLCCNICICYNTRHIASAYVYLFKYCTNIMHIYQAVKNPKDRQSILYRWRSDSWHPPNQLTKRPLYVQGVGTPPPI